MTHSSKSQSLLTPLNSTWAMFIVRLFRDFERNFADKSFMLKRPKKLHSMMISSATSLKEIRRFSTTISSLFQRFYHVLMYPEHRHQHLIGLPWRACTSNKYFVALIRPAKCHFQHFNCIETLPFVFHTKCNTYYTIHFFLANRCSLYIWQK